MTLTANSSGQIAGKFTIPANVPKGSKLVQFFGGNGGTTSSATFVGRGVIKIDEMQRVTTIFNRTVATWQGDPLAQTFIMDATKQIRQVDVWFAAKGTSKVLMQIREVELGFPTSITVAESILLNSEVKTTGVTSFTFPPVVLEGGKEYAIVLLCDDDVTSVWCGELGKFDTFANKWVTSQPYTVGVLLSSSNARTWTAHQEKDLAFRLIASDYSVQTNTTYQGSTAKEVPLDPVSVTNADQLMVFASVIRPTSDTDCLFEITVGSTVYTVVEGQSVALAEPYTGTVTWKAILTGTYEESPVLWPDVYLAAGTRRATGTYITRQMTAGNNTKITVIYDALLPGSSSVSVHAEGNGTWVSIPIDAGTQLGDGWQEVKHYLSDFDLDATRIRLTLSGSNTQRPIVRNLRVLLT